MLFSKEVLLWSFALMIHVTWISCRHGLRVSLVHGSPVAKVGFYVFLRNILSKNIMSGRIFTIFVSLNIILQDSSCRINWVSNRETCCGVIKGAYKCWKSIDQLCPTLSQGCYQHYLISGLEVTGPLVGGCHNDTTVVVPEQDDEEDQYSISQQEEKYVVAESTVSFVENILIIFGFVVVILLGINFTFWLAGERIL